MPHYHARVEFRRRERGAPWVLAGVIVEGRFSPAVDGVEPLRQRLPTAGLVGWADLPVPVVARDVHAAAEVALDVARARWPARARAVVPYATGNPGAG